MSTDMFHFNKVVEVLPSFQGSKNQIYSAERTRKDLIAMVCTNAWQSYARDCVCNFCKDFYHFITLYRSTSFTDNSYEKLFGVIACGFSSQFRSYVIRESGKENALLPTERGMKRVISILKEVAPALKNLKSDEDIKVFVESKFKIFEEKEKSKDKKMIQDEFDFVVKEDKPEVISEESILIKSLTEENDVLNLQKMRLEAELNLYTNIKSENAELKNRIIELEELNTSLRTENETLTSIKNTIFELVSPKKEETVSESKNNELEKIVSENEKSLSDTIQRGRNNKSKFVVEVDSKNIFCPFCGGTSCFIKKGKTNNGGSRFKCRNTNLNFSVKEGKMTYYLPL